MKENTDNTDSPWLIEVPPRSIAKSLRQAWQAYTDDCERERGLIAAGTAAKLLGVHRSRVYQLMEAKKLDVFEHFGTQWLSGAQLTQRLAEPKQVGGRPKLQAV
jgi:hypothetical protein